MKDGSTATISVQSVSGTGLSASMGATTTIILPSNWAALTNNTLSANVSSTVTVNSSVVGAGPGSVTYRATGVNSNGDTITRDDPMNVTWTTGSCAPVDTTPPQVNSINRGSGSPTNASSVNWNVTFSESVSGVDSSDFSLAASGLTGAAITSVTGSGSTRTVTAGTGTGDGTLGLNLVDDDSILDGASNKLGGTGAGNGNFTGQVYTIDKTAPDTSITANPAASTTDTSASFSFTGTDTVTTSGNLTFKCSLDGAGYACAQVRSRTAVFRSGLTPLM